MGRFSLCSNEIGVKSNRRLEGCFCNGTKELTTAYAIFFTMCVLEQSLECQGYPRVPGSDTRPPFAALLL